MAALLFMRQAALQQQQSIAAHRSPGDGSGDAWKWARLSNLYSRRQLVAKIRQAEKHEIPRWHISPNGGFVHFDLSSIHSKRAGSLDCAEFVHDEEHGPGI